MLFFSSIAASVKIALLVSGSVATTLLVTNSGRLFEPNVLQPQFFVGGGLKVLPDPANVYEWTSEGIQVSGGGGAGIEEFPIVIDLDGNGVADQMQPGSSLIITDWGQAVDPAQLSPVLMSRSPSGEERLIWSRELPGVLTDSRFRSFYSPVTPTVVQTGHELFLRVTSSSPATLTSSSFRFRGRLVSH